MSGGEGIDAARAYIEILARERQALVEAEPVSFHSYVRRSNPTLLRFEHIPRLIDVGERIITGSLSNVLVLLPPRYFKSEIFSRLLPGAFLERHPEAWAAVASYGADLAWELSEEARGYYVRDGGELRLETTAKKRWRNIPGGGVLAAGVGGQWLGRGFTLGVVDDPTDPEKADSFLYARKFAKWFPGKFLSRREPGARLVFVMQRLGPGDPVDFLFRREVGEDTDEAPLHWHVVVCDEIRDDGPLGRWDGPQGLPPTCTLEPDPRPKGAVLAPSRFSRGEVLAMQADAGLYVNAAQRQQRPAAPTGDFWREEWFHVYDELPADAFDGGKDWDTAYTDREANSASAFVESYRGPEPPSSNGKAHSNGKANGKSNGKAIKRRKRFPIYIEDVDWRWIETPELVDWMLSVDGPHFIEAKASGKSAAQTLRREGVTVKEVTVQGDKLARSSGVQPVVSQGRVFVNRRVLRKLLHGPRQGLLRVNAEKLVAGGPDLDLNDAFVEAVARHTGGRKRFGAWYPGIGNGAEEDEDVEVEA